MKRTDFDSSYLSNDEKIAYFKRLMKPYTKCHQKKYFINQYLDGDGNELNKKFWSRKSSSRFAFELYSWIANEASVTDFCFEKKLRTIKDSPKAPNMDVYIETKDTITFIESKLTERTSPNINKLSESYYEDDAKSSKQSLKDRYYKDEFAATEINAFVKDVKQLLTNCKDKASWMDYKQEITHLIGIYLTIKNEQSKFKNKKIKFFNIYYDFGDPETETINAFFEKANSFMKKLLNGLCVSFTYGHMSAQDMVKSKDVIEFDLNKHAFASNVTVGSMLARYFPL